MCVCFFPPYSTDEEMSLNWNDLLRVILAAGLMHTLWALNVIQFFKNLANLFPVFKMRFFSP